MPKEKKQTDTLKRSISRKELDANMNDVSTWMDSIDFSK
jgi:hypothetical protein